MDQRTKNIGVAFCLMAMAFFAAWPFWKWVYLRSAPPAVRTHAQSLVEKNPQLKPAWDVANQDGVITIPEAKVIIEAAGEKMDAEK